MKVKEEGSVKEKTVIQKLKEYYSYISAASLLKEIIVDVPKYLVKILIFNKVS